MTPHFRVIYHDGLESAARVVALKAESIFDRVTREVGGTPTERTPIVVAEYAIGYHGLAIPFKHRIYLTGNVINIGRIDRDTSLEAMLGHEFTHICTFWALRGGPQGYREAVTGVLPTWFVEGMAHRWTVPWRYYGGYNILRAAVLEDTLPKLAEIDTGETYDLTDRWLTYDVGQSMVNYMAETWDNDVLARLLVNLRRFPIFDRALHQTIGITSRTLYHRWREWIRAYSEEQTRGRKPLVEYSERLPVPLQYCFGARWSPNGEKVAILGIEDGEESVIRMFVANADGSGLREIAKDLDIKGSTRFSWSSDSRCLAYARLSAHTNGYTNIGIWLWDSQTGSTERITGDLKAVDPAWSPDGKHIAFVLYDAEGATSRIALMDPDGGNIRRLTQGPGIPDNAIAPTWSPDGSRIAFEVVERGMPNIAMMRIDGTGYEKLTDDLFCNRSPTWSPLGDRIAFTSYRDGLQQVYTLDVETRALLKHTDEGIGTPYDPAWTPDGENLTCVLFRSKVAEIHTFPATHTEPLPLDEEPEGGRVLSGEDETIPWGEVPRPMAEQKIDTSTWTTQVYHSTDYIHTYLAYPDFAFDPFGQDVAMRLLAEDPLGQQQVTAQIGYGLGSQRLNWTFDYVNSKNRANIEFRAFDRLRQWRPFETVEVVDAGQGIGVAAIYPRIPKGSPLYREEFRAGLSSERITPLAVTGPTLGVPLGGQSGVFELSYNRSRYMPAEGNARLFLSYRGALPRPLGGLALREVDAAYEFTRTWSGRRRLLTASVGYRNVTIGQLDGPTLSGAAILPRITYHQRISDDKGAGAWPLLYPNRIDVEFSYEYLATAGFPVFNRPDGHRLRAEIQNRGWLNKVGRYRLRTGVVYDVGLGSPQFFFYPSFGF